MRRRGFIGLMGGAVAWPLAAHAQSAKTPVIGFFSASSASATRGWVAALMERLAELGWIEGRSIGVVYRWADGRNERLAEIAKELVALQVDVIITHSAGPVIAAKQATANIPIVFATAADPLGTGLVANLSRPGGNVTGLSSQTAELASKRLEVLRELTPALRRIVVMANMDVPSAVLDVADTQASAQKTGIEVLPLDVRRAEDIAPAFEAIKGRADALLVAPEPFALTNRARLNSLAASQRLPTMYGAREYVETGGLASYGPNLASQFRRAADYVDKILRGTKAGDIPIEQPTKFDLVINLNTAKEIGLAVPSTLLARADEVIE